MENNNNLETIALHLEQDASVKNVYGDPVEVRGKTIIPVARIAVGMGSGFGRKGRSGKAFVTENTEGENEPAGGGAGGGMVAMPKGIFVLSEKKTKYIPADPNRYLLLGGVAGFLLARLFFRRRKA